MTDKIKNKEISPNFSVRIDIACADKKLVFTGKGDEETGELFFSVLKRLAQRMQKSEYLVEPLYELEYVDEKQANICVSKEELEDLMYAILSQ